MTWDEWFDNYKDRYEGIHEGADKPSNNKEGEIEMNSNPVAPITDQEAYDAMITLATYISEKDDINTLKSSVEVDGETVYMMFSISFGNDEDDK